MDLDPSDRDPKVVAMQLLQQYPNVSAQVIRNQTPFRFSPILSRPIHKDLTKPGPELISALAIERAIFLTLSHESAGIADEDYAALSQFKQHVGEGVEFSLKKIDDTKLGYTYSVRLPNTTFPTEHTLGLYVELGEQLKNLGQYEKMRQLNSLGEEFGFGFALAVGCKSYLSTSRLAYLAGGDNGLAQNVYFTLKNHYPEPWVNQKVFSLLEQKYNLDGDDPLWFGYPLQMKDWVEIHLNSIVSELVQTQWNNNWRSFKYEADSPIFSELEDIGVTSIYNIKRKLSSSMYSYGRLVINDDPQQTIRNIKELVYQ